ncbi:MAG: hypothetical protein HDR30_10215 [Lachnospiraceae bacterium]|nr:hypothetical protein [Lachnospiraceae bacterium]
MIDFDGAKLYMHAMEMWRNKSFLIPDWKYITTMELDCSLLLAVPFYGLLHNIFLAFGISNMIMVCCYIIVIYMIFNYTPYRIHAFAAVNLVLMPYAYGMLAYFNMMFFNGSQYVIKVMLPLLFVLLLTIPVEKRRTKGTLILITFYFLLLFLTSMSSGVYVMFCGILPLLLYTGFDFLYHQEIKKYSKYHLSICIISFAAFLSGSLMGKMSGIAARGNILCLTKSENWQLNLHAILLGFFQALDCIPTQDIAVMSADGIIYLVKILLLSLLLIACICQLKYLFSPTADVNAERLLAILFPWNLLIMFFIDTRYSPANLTMEYRYYFIALVPLMLLLPMQIEKWIQHSSRIFHACISALTVISLLLLMIGCDKNIWKNREISQYADDICDYINSLEMETDSVFFIPDEETPEICRLLDPAHTYCGYNADAGLVIYDYYQSYIDRSSHGNHNLILVYEWETPDMYLPSYISSHYEKVGTVRWYDVYYSPVNFFDNVSGFSAFGNSIDFFFSPGYVTNGGISFINNWGELEVNGNGEEAVRSGEFTPVEGEYHIMLSYEITQEMQQDFCIGTMEIWNGDELVDAVTLLSGQKSATLDNIAVLNRSLNIRIKINDGISCRLQSLYFTKCS